MASGVACGVGVGVGLAAVARATALALTGAVLAVGPAVAAGPETPSERRGELTPNQLTAGRTLTSAEALAACGPAAAVALARARGREVTLDRAVALAREVGWTAEQGMAGPSSLVALLKRMQVPATLEAGLDRARIVREVRAGRPVVVRTAGEGGHYLVAERYDAQSGAFDFGQSAMVVKRAAGQRWFGLNEISSLGVGTPTHAIYLEPGRPEQTNILAALVRAPAAPIASAGPTTRSTPTSGATANQATGRWIVDTDGWGARLRSEPSTEAEVVASLLDGARLTAQGAAVRAEGRVWRRVIGGHSGVAWIDAALLRPEEDGAAAGR